MQLLSTHRQEAQGITNLPQITQLGSGEASTGIQTVRLQSLSLSVLPQKGGKGVKVCV